jgi:excisionase family DNA binding protein
MTLIPAGDWVTVAEAGVRLGVSKRRVQAIIADGSGRLPAARVGNVLLIQRTDLERFAGLVRPPGAKRKKPPPATKPRKAKRDPGREFPT